MIFLKKILCGSGLSCALIFFCANTAGADAVSASSLGSLRIAPSDSHAWPELLNTNDAFNKASRASIKIYTEQLKKLTHLSDQDILLATNIKSVNRASVDKWLKREIQLSVKNFALAAQNCTPSDWTCRNQPVLETNGVNDSTEKTTIPPEKFLLWKSQSEEFARAYLLEQIRLAALFPKITSEIDIFSNNEWTGDNLTDGNFYLSFDDGPTNPQGNTDDTLRMLDQTHHSAIFFVLGGSLQKRIAATSVEQMNHLYAGQCVASHGWEHQSHASWDQWQNSVVRTQRLIQQIFGDSSLSHLFRPPYGQRKSDSDEFFKSQRIKVALWNIDSQDWNSHMTPTSVQYRILNLMLIKRHGVILFHDIHGNAKVALPNIFELLGQAIKWQDCHTANTIE